MRQEFKVLSLFKFHDIKKTIVVSVKVGNVQRLAPLRGQVPDFRNKKGEAKAQVHRVFLELESVERRRKTDFAFFHAINNLGFGDDGHGWFIPKYECYKLYQHYKYHTNYTNT